MKSPLSFKHTFLMPGLAIGILAAGSVFCPNARAASFTWNFTTASGNAGSTGNSLSFSSSPSGGPSITATAWYLNGTVATGTLQKAALGQYSHGLGVCTPTELGAGCLSPEHQVDNNTNYEFVLFKFASSVDPTSVTITSTSGGDLDVTYYTGNVAASDLSGATLAGLSALGFGAAVNDDSTLTTSRSVSITSGFVNSMLFGARVSGDGNLDYFKIGDMAGNTPVVVTAVPEPFSVVLLGTVLLAVAHLMRKRRLA